MSQNKYENNVHLHKPPPLFKHRLDIITSKLGTELADRSTWPQKLHKHLLKKPQEAFELVQHHKLTTHTHTHTVLHHRHKVTQFTHDLRGRKHNCSEETQRFTSSRKQEEGGCNRSLQRKTAACHEFIQMRAFVKVADDSH